MNLSFSKDSGTNTILTRAHDRVPMYHVETKESMLSLTTPTTKIIKFNGNYPATQMGAVEIHSFSDNVCSAWGRNFLPKRSGLLGSKRFTGSDGISYTWQGEITDMKLVQADNKHVIVAQFHVGSSGFWSGKSRPTLLSIYPPGMHIIDEIIVTYFYTRQIKTHKLAAEAAGEVGSAVGDAGGGGAS